MLKSNWLSLKQLTLGLSISFFLAGPTCADTTTQSEVNSDSIFATVTNTKLSSPDRTVAEAWKRVAWHPWLQRVVELYFQGSRPLLPLAWKVGAHRSSYMACLSDPLWETYI